MSKSIVIGKYLVKEATRLSRCPSYYAADYEVLELTPGEYELKLVFETGFTCPMPKSVGASVPAVRVEGKLYSGFGGLNYSSRDLPVEPVDYSFTTYVFNLRSMIERGDVELAPGFEWVASEDYIGYAKGLKWGEGILA